METLVVLGEDVYRNQLRLASDTVDQNDVVFLNENNYLKVKGLRFGTIIYVGNVPDVLRSMFQELVR